MFFFQAEDGIRDLTVTGVQTCALPISTLAALGAARRKVTCPSDWTSGETGRGGSCPSMHSETESMIADARKTFFRDRKSTRLNSSHSQISYAVFCLKKKKNNRD